MAPGARSQCHIGGCRANELFRGHSSPALKLASHLLPELRDDFTHHFVITLFYSRAPLSGPMLNFRTAEGIQRIERVRCHFDSLTFGPIGFNLLEFFCFALIFILRSPSFEVEDAKCCEVCLSSFLSETCLSLGLARRANHLLGMCSALCAGQPREHNADNSRRGCGDRCYPLPGHESMVAVGSALRSSK